MHEWPKKIFWSLAKAAHDAEEIGPSRHAAALTYRDKIICVGVAQTKSHPMMKEYSGSEKKISLHAEIDAITKGIRILGEGRFRRNLERNCVADLSDCSLYVLRISRGNNISLSKPCLICQKAIDAFGIKQTYWSS